MSQMMQMYQQVGPAQFSAMIGQFAPYFASIARSSSNCVPAMPKSPSPSAARC